jgi:polyketide cyclase/dehydrase/lipid transport protein
MRFAMRHEDLAFIDRAPMVQVMEGTVGVDPPAVFAALADAPAWPRWFPGVRAAWYSTTPPHGVGSIREANVGGTDWVEKMIAWDDPSRWAWTVISASLPFAAAQVESFELAPTANGTRVRWTIALEPRLLARLGRPFMRRATASVFARAMCNLDAHLVGRR